MNTEEPETTLIIQGFEPYKGEGDIQVAYYSGGEIDIRKDSVSTSLGQPNIECLAITGLDSMVAVRDKLSEMILTFHEEAEYRENQKEIKG